MWAYAKVLAKNKQKDEARMYEERVRTAMAQSGNMVLRGRTLSMCVRSAPPARQDAFRETTVSERFDSAAMSK